MGISIKTAISLALWLEFVSTSIASLNYFKAKLIDLSSAIPLALQLLIGATICFVDGIVGRGGGFFNPADFTYFRFKT